MLNQILLGDSRKVIESIPDKYVHTVITSPPYYGLRDYQMPNQIGLEETPQQYIHNLVELFGSVKRILKDDGTLWLNLGDSYSPSAQHGYKIKDLMGMPWRVALALQDDGWYLRQDIIWQKSNPMPEPVKDRCVKCHEYIFLLTKSEKYYFDHISIQEDAIHKSSGNAARKPATERGAPKDILSGNAPWSGTKRNKRSVWTVSVKPFKPAHFATFPLDLIEPCVLAGAPIDGIVFDPFMGSGTTAVAAKKHHRNYLGVELNPEYIGISQKRLESETLF